MMADTVGFLTTLTPGVRVDVHMSDRIKYGE